MHRLAAILISAWLAIAPTVMADPGDIVAAARSRIRYPYAWGATGPDRFDCSGLVVWAYAQAGISVPRTSQQQANAGQPVDRADLQPGDIVIYYPTASHVGIYVGDGDVIHASMPGRPVTEVPIDAAGPYRNARRLLPRKADMTLFYPDVSNNNWRTTHDAINFLSKLAGEGFAAVCHKVTEGASYRDPYWPAVRDWCKTNGMLLIGYHYVRTGDPATQARLYRDHVGDLSIPCMLDFEDGSGDITQFWAVVKAFNAVGIEIALSYLPRWYWRDHIGAPPLVGVPGLVSSAYPGGGGYASALYEWGGGNQGSGWAAYGGVSPVVWQFSDRATVAGIPVDVNAFRGSLDDFKKVLGITPGGTMPAPSNDDKLNYIYGQLQPYPQLAGKPDALDALREKIAAGLDLTLVDAFAAHIHGLFTEGN